MIGELPHIAPRPYTLECIKLGYLYILHGDCYIAKERNTVQYRTLNPQEKTEIIISVEMICISTSVPYLLTDASKVQEIGLEKDHPEYFL